jgi:hypothetical protein
MGKKREDTLLRPGRAASFSIGSQVDIVAGDYVGQRGTVVAQRNEWGLWVVVGGHLLRSIADSRLRLVEPVNAAEATLRADLKRLLPAAYDADRAATEPRRRR